MVLWGMGDRINEGAVLNGAGAGGGGSTVT